MSLWRLLGAWLLVLSPALAWGDCVDRAAPTVPRWARQAIAYGLAADAGHNVAPHDGQGLQVGQSQLDAVCFDGLTVAQIGSFLTDQTMADRWTAEEAARQAAAAAAQAQVAAFQTEVTTNDLCTATLDELVSRINTERDAIQADIDAASNLAQAKTAMTTMNTKVAAALRKVAKCLRARVP